MKKIIITAALVLFMSLGDSAYAFRPMRPYKVDMSVSVSPGFSSATGRRFHSGYLDYKHLYDGRYPSVEARFEDSMEHYVENSGTYTFRVETKLYEWLVLGGEVSYAHFRADAYRGLVAEPLGKRHGDVIYVMPEVRFRYFRTRLSTMSSAISAGVGFHWGFRHTVYPELQVYPFTYTLGSKIYGKAELTFGTMLNGVSFGAGIRF